MTPPPSFRSGSRITGELNEFMLGVYPPANEAVRHILPGVQEYDKAHAVALIESGAIPSHAGKAIIRELLNLEAQGAVEARISVGGQAHSGEQFLRAVLGPEVSGWLPLGRSSSDIWTVSVRLTQRQRICQTANVLCHAQQVFLDLARQHLDSLMVGYTHLQQAQVTTLGHYFVSVAAENDRNITRLLETLCRVDVSTAGSAVLTGSPFPLNTARLSELLGFGETFINSRDAAFGLDYLTEDFANVALATNLFSRLSNDLMLWCTSEFGYLELADEFCTASSILPQKKNPVALQFVRGVATQATGELVSALGTASSLADSIIVDRELVIENLWHIHDGCDQSANLLASLLKTAVVNVERMERTARSSWCFASELAAVLVLKKGLPWRTAHAAVGTFVRLSLQRSPDALNASISDLQTALSGYEYDVDGLEQILKESRDPSAAIHRRIVRGGPAPSDVRQQIQSLSVSLQSSAEKLRMRAARWEQARLSLATLCAELASN